ncbi:hypothetical protein VNO78_13190 [Psophocarpus tetragonolobus]|uniref:RING-type E3 ubiquitin transferase n=1 Tax=Psophocarpus tetragonolobus TaxID=3891 RepID=A0AAN9XPV1_PSOTE
MATEEDSVVFGFRRIFATILVANSEARSEVRRARFVLKFLNTDPLDDLIFQRLEFSLINLGVPQSFLNGYDSDMIKNLLKMLLNSIEQQCCSYVGIFVMVHDACCCYNIVNNAMWLYCDELIPLREFVNTMACNSRKHSLPAGATTLERFKIKDDNTEDKEEKDKCIICFEEFSCDVIAARMPCSHVCHYHCILKWFVKSSTCPMCRFQCNCVL